MIPPHPRSSVEGSQPVRAGFRSRFLAFAGILTTATSVFLGATPAQADPLATSGAPEGVDFRPKLLYHLDNDGGIIGSGPVGPGRTFFAVFEVRNTSDVPVTVTGFTPSFWFIMNPARQGSLPDDYCLQFFETRTFPQRDLQQSYPLVLLPGESVDLYDHMTYHYIHGPVSNECQGGSFTFGSPTFYAPPLPSTDPSTAAPRSLDATPPERIEAASA